MSAYNKKVQIQNIIESQIPSFLNQDSPLFREFLNQYYLSQEHPTGIIDITRRLTDLKNIETYNNELFYTLFVPCTIANDVTAFDTTIEVNHTIGFPDYYGLLKIDEEIITYESKTQNSFVGCSRGFSGITEVSKKINSSILEFSKTKSSQHSKDSVVSNLNLVFYEFLFTKFKAQFLPGFENRDFISKVKITNILTRSIDFYLSKGTEVSYKLLFKVLFDQDVSMIKPQNYILRPSDDNFFTTDNVLLEQISGSDPLSIKGKTLYQDFDNGVTASASIYSVEYRPVNGKDFYEVYLDSTSINYSFLSTKKTNISKRSKIGSNSIFVDSTVGFEKSGTLLLKGSNTINSFITLTYNDKTNNQFLGVSGVIVDLDIGDEVIESNFVYTFDDDNNKLEFRLANVIGEVDYENSSNLLVNDKISLSSFGVELGDKPEFYSWRYNIPTRHQIKNIEKTNDISGNIYTVTFYENIKFYLNEEISLTRPEDLEDSEIYGYVNLIISDDTIQIFCNSEASGKTVLNKQIALGKSNLDIHTSIKDVPVTIQNTYIDTNNEYYYVVSSGVPDYEIYSDIQRINVSTSTGTGKTDILETDIIHKFYTGEKIYYFPEENSGIQTGIYHLTAVGSNKDSKQVKLSLSKNDLFSKKYITFDRTITSDTFVKLDYENKEIKNQKILKKFPLNKGDSILKEVANRSTNNKTVGIMVNGVELYSPTLFDENVYYGKLESIEITNSGTGYDVINPPELMIFDNTGYGATAYLNITGNLKDVKIVSPGIGYQQKPKITIVGGNGSGAVVEPNLVKTRITSTFRGDGLGVNPTIDVITFQQKHNFDDGEEIVYNSNFNAEVFPLKNNASYFAGVIDDFSLKLYESQSDSFDKINAINLVGISSGSHNFTTLTSKSTITKLYVKDSGSGYSNKSIKVPSTLAYDGTINGVNTFDDYIFAKNHRFNNKDILRYSTTDTSIGGLSTTSEYIVTVLDENKFKLSDVGIGTQPIDLNYENRRYVNLTSLGIGTHTFSYPPIRIEVEALSGIAATTIIQPEFEPIITGSIESVFIENSGVGYGVSDILNFHRRPNIQIKSVDSEALLRPIIVNGSIVDVQFLSFGRGYDKGVDIIVTGSGDFADIRPIVEDGKIVDVVISNGGIGYNQNNTEIIIQRRGRDAKFIGNVFEWKINQVEKNKEILKTPDEGVLAPNKNTDLGIRLVNFYIPKIIRENLNDHIDKISKREVVNNVHSPIIGWAYDGNPIYGPYGKVGNEIRKINSSYEKRVESNKGLRPDFPDGFFLQDFYYDRALGDLDEYNGRFCVTPDYPNGVYAYFSTIDNNPSSSPAYPYVIGEEFKDYIIQENSIPTYTNDVIIEQLDLLRNVSPYYINSSKSDYPLIPNVDKKYKQEFNITSTLSSGVDNIDIYSPGDNYKVGDNIIFNNSNTGGTGLSAEIDRIGGKDLTKIEVGISTFLDVSFSTKANRVSGITQNPHGFVTGDNILITTISKSKYSYLEGFKSIIVPQKSVGITSNISVLGITGQTTNIKVNDVTNFYVNDIIKIDQEILKIIDIFPETSEFKVNRLQFTGVHTAGVSSVTLLPTRFYFSENEINEKIIKNDVYYFDAKNYIGFGTQQNNYSLPNGENLTIEPRGIYIKDHNFYTGQKVRYNVGLSGTSILVSNEPNQSNVFPLLDNEEVYVVNFGTNVIGLTTNISGIGSSRETLYIWDDVTVTGNAHSITTLYENITGTVENFNLFATTAEDHLLLDGDNIKFNLFPDRFDDFKLRYDTELRKITTEIVDFDVNVSVSSTTSEFYLPNNSFETGDKIVYYNKGNSTIGGLVNNNTYYVIKEKRDYIKLSEFYVNSQSGIGITLTSQGSGSQGFALINPSLKSTKGNKIRFDLSDSTLSGMDLILYKDSNLLIELESYNYSRNSIDAGSENAELIVDTNSESISNTLFYSLIPLSSTILEKFQISVDNEVIGNNKIVISPSTYTENYSVISVGSTQFRFNLFNRPDHFYYDATNGISTISYDTNSKNTIGPISSVRINFEGIGYKKIPTISSIDTENGSGAILKASSNRIGKIDTIERVKDGFDYPTDETLKPVLSVPTVCQIKDILRVGSVGILTGGNNYNIAPTLKVIGNDDIELEAVLQGGSVVDVNIIQNVTNLSGKLPIIPTRNSNGFDIDDIVYNPIENSVTLELVNSDTQLYPLIENEYGEPEIDFPFKVGDLIFIENCKISEKSEAQGFNNYNSSNFGYRFFTVTGINTSDFTVKYSMNGIAVNMGDYNTDINYGYVINKKNMAEFEMNVADDLSYFSGEDVIGYDSNGFTVFTATIMESGWSNDINQLRLFDSKGELEVGNKLLGTRSRLNGTVSSINKFNLTSRLDVSRKKINDFKDRTGYLNDYQQRLADNDYYQKFSYSLKSQLPYTFWSESVRSLVHPSGFKEFSDLDVVGTPSNNMKVGVGDSSLNVSISIDNVESMYNRYNFSMVTEEDLLPDGSVERIYFPEGLNLTPYILSKTNKVALIDDISNQFTGISSDIGGTIVGLSTFKLKNKEIPLFYREFDSTDFNTVSLDNNKFLIENHNYQTGQRIFYDVEKVSLDPEGRAVTVVDVNYVPPTVSNRFDSPIFTFDSSEITFDSN